MAGYRQPRMGGIHNRAIVPGQRPFQRRPPLAVQVV